jgi:large subunit ribosomal protein L25
METVTLKATSREEQGKGAARRLRATGMLPSVAYGRGGKTVAVAIAQDALRAILKSERGRNTVIGLEVEGSERFSVMVKAFEIHPLSRRILHADFIRIDENAPVEVEVPFVTLGKSKGEVEGGTLLANTRLLPVRCLPANIPGHLEHECSALGINDVVKVKDLTLPPGIEVLLPPERKVVYVAPPRIEVVEKPAEGEAAAEGEAPAEGEAAPAATEAKE